MRAKRTFAPHHRLYDTVDGTKVLVNNFMQKLDLPAHDGRLPRIDAVEAGTFAPLLFLVTAHRSDQRLCRSRCVQFLASLSWRAHLSPAYQSATRRRLAAGRAGAHEGQRRRLQNGILGEQTEYQQQRKPRRSLSPHVERLARIRHGS
jgi:hypothetical protein